MRKTHGVQLKQKQILSLFVGGLPSIVTEDSIRAGFEWLGEIQSIKVAKNKKSQLSKGYAYVYLKTSLTVEAIVSKKVVIQERDVDVQLASSKSEKKVQGSMNNQRKIFVGNLPVEATGDDLQRTFKHFGEIVRAYIIYDFFSRESKGYGYVEFRDSSSASEALKSSIVLREHSLSILPYVSKNEKRRSKVQEEPQQHQNLGDEEMSEDPFKTFHKEALATSENTPSSVEEKSASFSKREIESRPTIIGSFSQQSEGQKNSNPDSLATKTNRLEGQKPLKFKEEPSSPDIVERSGFIIKGPVPKLPQTTKPTKALILDAAKQLDHNEHNYRFKREVASAHYSDFFTRSWIHSGTSSMFAMRAQVRPNPGFYHPQPQPCYTLWPNRNY